MARIREIIVECPYCHLKQRGEVFVEDTDSFDLATSWGNRQRCVRPRCQRLIPCDKTTMSYVLEGGQDGLWNAPGNASAENMRLRLHMMVAIAAHIQQARLTQQQAADLFGVSQTRVSDLVLGKMQLFSLDVLVNMLAAAGLRVEMRVMDAA